MIYAKEINGTLVQPVESEFHGVPGWRTHDALLRSKDYLPVHGYPPQEDGKRIVIDSYEKVVSSDETIEPRQTVVITTNENGEMTYGYEMEDTPVSIDTSYWIVTAWHYVDLPVPVQPTPAPEPVKYSKYALKLACEKRGLWEQVKSAIEAAGKWESFLLIQAISSDNAELQEALPGIRQIFGSDVVDAVLEESEM